MFLGSSAFPLQWSALRKPLPPNVHMLTLEQWQQPKLEPVETSQILLRFEHIYEKDEDPVLSQPATVNLVSSPLKEGFMIIPH